MMNGRSVRWFFPLGLACAVAGVVAAAVPAHLSHAELLAALAEETPFVACGLGCALLFATFSAMSIRHLPPERTTSVPLANLACGGVLGVCSGALEEPIDPTWPACAALLYVSIFCTCFAKLAWENALRRGNAEAVTAFAFLAPVLSTAMSSWTLGV